MHMLKTTEQSLTTTAEGRAAPVSERLNNKCFCMSLDHAALRNALASELALPELLALVEERCPYLFSARPVFISDSHAERMANVVRAVELVVALPAYRSRILEGAPVIWVFRTNVTSDSGIVTSHSIST